MSKRKVFDWEKIYKDIPFDNMGWYHPSLDPDLESYLGKHEFSTGSFLDIGTGAGNQAVELSKKGFTVVGTDISQTAIREAAKRFSEVNSVQFVVDDILNTKLEQGFDYIFDRGCYHNIKEDERLNFVQTIHTLLAADGLFFLKCFTDNPDINGGPFDFTEEMIKTQFEGSFSIENIQQTSYQGTLKQNPNALFVVMRKK